MKSLRLAATGLIAILALSLGLAEHSAEPAGAEITSYAEEGWGVYDSVTSGTLSDRIDSEVMAIEQIGNVVYVGGKFTNVRQWRTGPATSRPFLAAFDATTGAWLPDFAPNLDGPV